MLRAPSRHLQQQSHLLHHPGRILQHHCSTATSQGKAGGFSSNNITNSWETPPRNSPSPTVTTVAYHSTQITPDSTKTASLSVFHETPPHPPSQQPVNPPSRTQGEHLPPHSNTRASLSPMASFQSALVHDWQRAETHGSPFSRAIFPFSLPNHLRGGELTFLVGSNSLRQLWENSLCRWSRSGPFPSLSAHRCRRFFLS